MLAPIRYLLGLLLLAPSLVAQSSKDPWSDLRAKNPPGMEFLLHPIAPHEYRAGEVIRMEMKFPGKAFAGGDPPPQERWQYAGFLVDPPLTCGTIQMPCDLSSSVGLGRGFGDPLNDLGERQNPLAFTLNNYIPALLTGHYRIAALVQKLVLISHKPSGNTYGYSTPRQFVVSETADFDIVPAPAEWLQETITTSAAVLTSTASTDSASSEKRRMAAQQLGFLNVPDAWLTILNYLPVEENSLLNILSVSDEPAKICDLMRKRISDPEQTVSSLYLSSLVKTCQRANVPPPVKTVLSEQERLDYVIRLGDYRADLLTAATSLLASSLPQKKHDPEAIALHTLIEYVQELRNELPSKSDPAWVPALRTEFLRFVPGTAISVRQSLIGSYAALFRSRDIVPIAESILDAWTPGDQYPDARAAIGYLANVDPDRAHQRIIAELTKPKTWLDIQSLSLLPAASVPEMDDALIDALALSQKPPGWNPELRMAAIAKYATPKAVDRIKAIYESLPNRCQPELMAYFVRVDPQYADNIFHDQAWDMHAKPPSCTAPYFERTSPLAMSSGLERFMSAYLMHDDNRVAISAARSLGRYGSENASLKALWDAFRAFHESWKDKKADLWNNYGARLFETELRTAIALGQNWLATDEDFQKIESLCVSDQCLAATESDLQMWKQPLRISIFDNPDGIHGSIAQYSRLEGVPAIETKLSQFPRGTRFIIYVRDEKMGPIVARLRTIARDRGLVISDPPSATGTK